MSSEFQCARCKGIFPKGWSDEESLAESRELFGEIPPEHRVPICDVCFAEFMKWYNTR
jgi:hypothetical protein